jgi:hypothetical protein
MKIQVAFSPYGLDVNNLHRISVLVTGPANFDSEEAETTGMNFVNALARLYPADTEFQQLYLAATNAKGEVLPNQSLTLPINVNGAFVPPANARLAPANNVAVFKKMGSRNPHGFLRLPYCILSSELDDYTQSNTTPSRFTVGATVALPNQNTFIEDLTLIGLDANLQLALPDARGDLQIAMRPVAQIRWVGFRSVKMTRNKQSTKSMTRELAQRKIAELAAKARYADAPDDTGAKKVTAAAIVAGLRLKAVVIYNSLDFEEKARIVWPAIFNPEPNPV